MNQRALEEIAQFTEDKFLQNQIAQLQARYILFNTDEDKKNFPNYNLKEDNLTLLGFQYLNLGCRLAENDLIEEAASTLEKGAEILELIYGSPNNEVDNRTYYVLIASLAYYCGFQYSKSFILIQKVEGNTLIHQLVSSFLKRDYSQLQELINLNLVRNEISSEELSDYEKFVPIRIYEKVISKSLGKLIGYLRFGNEDLLEEAKEDIRTLKDIAEGREEPEIWWVLRLLLLIIKGVENASLWSVLRNYYKELPSAAQQYIYSHVFSKNTRIHEFFSTQRNALKQVFKNEKGLVVSMPTSSGKTRIAEVGILECKIKYPDSKIVFIAPYKSLAFEIENNLNNVFAPTGIRVSQLYGGSLYNKIDESIVQENDVIIATQEKAKALLRSNSDIIKSIKLIILDEGHLLGNNERYIRSELLIEELKFSLEKNNGKFILLSAVLPNPEELSEWLTLSKENVFKDGWRPSEERLGVLEWTGKEVHLKWKSADNERDSFNRNFIVSKKQPRIKNQRKDKFFPKTKNEAIVLTAHKLLNFGPVLIFVGQKRSCFTLAENYLKALGENATDFVWKDKRNWKAFELSCIESDGEDSKWLKFARKGIFCHNSDLPDVPRLALERLMRTEKPHVIIATSTLGQGVNLGVSTVIFSTLFQSGNPIEHGDFWNIAGRAGRAFVDHEGKILIAHDKQKEKWQIKKELKLIDFYFDKSRTKRVESGLLAIIKQIKVRADTMGIEINELLELISENSYEDIPDDFRTEVVTGLDQIDDTLLTLHHHFSEFNFNDLSWVEKYFKKSLAYLQVRDDNGEIEPGEFIDIIRFRIKGIIKAVGEENADWKKHINSGLPLQSDFEIEKKFDEIVMAISQFIRLESNELESKVQLLAEIEGLIYHIPILYESYLQDKNIDKMRKQWLQGVPLSKIKNLGHVKIINEYFSFKLPWVLNGISNKLSDRGYNSHAEVIQQLSVLIETGLPDLTAVKIYQAGLRSRTACTEIARILIEENWDGTMYDIKKLLSSTVDNIKAKVSNSTVEWIEIFRTNVSNKLRQIKYIEPFIIEEATDWKGPLIAKKVNGQGYLVSFDHEIVFSVRKINDRNFDEVYDTDGIYFFKNSEEQTWMMEIRNPHIEIDNTL